MACLFLICFCELDYTLSIFFFCLSSYTGLPEGRVILLRIASQQAKTKLGPVRPCVQIWEPGRGVGHQQDPKPAPLEPCEAVVDESSPLEQHKSEQKPAHPPLGGGVSLSRNRDMHQA